jgi:hypothetical protein
MVKGSDYLIEIYAQDAKFRWELYHKGVWMRGDKCGTRAQALAQAEQAKDALMEQDIKKEEANSRDRQG